MTCFSLFSCSSRSEAKCDHRWFYQKNKSWHPFDSEANNALERAHSLEEPVVRLNELGICQNLLSPSHRSDCTAGAFWGRGLPGLRRTAAAREHNIWSVAPDPARHLVLPGSPHAQHRCAAAGPLIPHTVDIRVAEWSSVSSCKRRMRYRGRVDARDRRRAGGRGR